MIFFSLLSLALSDSLSPSFQYQEEEEEEEDNLNIRPTSQLTTIQTPPTSTHHHNQPTTTTTTANPLQHQFNPNTINPKLMKNHHKPNLKSTQTKTPKNSFGKIQINPKPKPQLPGNACRRHERESVRECECIEPWRLGREKFFFWI